MSDIFDEVNEEFRRSRAEQLWKRYGWLVIGACAVLVLGVAGWRYDIWRKELAAAAAGARFETALSRFTEGKGREGETELEAIIAAGHVGYSALARFRLAAEVGRRDPVAGLKAFDAIAADAAVDAAVRDMARLRAGVIAVDAVSLADVEQRLAPLTSGQNAFRHQANELIALAALKAGDGTKAQRHLDAIIIDREAPSDMRDRAGTLIGIARGVK